MKNYPIYEGEKTVGEAQVDREGLYYVIRCCGPLTDVPRRICVKCSGRSIMLGLWVPNGDQMTLLRRIPKYKLDSDDITFSVYSETEKGVLISPNRPLEDISWLKRARLEQRDGKRYIHFLGQSSSSPTGQ